MHETNEYILSNVQWVVLWKAIDLFIFSFAKKVFICIAMAYVGTNWVGTTNRIGDFLQCVSGVFKYLLEV